MGGCSSGISREHVFSKSLFLSTEITVQGFAWCKDEPKNIGIGSLTAKILCGKHNSGLSPVDSAAAKAFDVLREQNLLANQRKERSLKTLLNVVRFHIDAKLLERWFLKTLLNLTYQGDYFIGSSGIAKGEPPLDLVEICFGLKPFPGNAGMYGAANPGMDMDSLDTVTFAPVLTENNTRVIAGIFEFRGLRFLLSLSETGLQVPLSAIGNLPPEWRNAKLIRPLKKLMATHGKRISHVVVFDW